MADSGNNSIEIAYFKSPVGELILGAYGEKLCLCDWRHRKMRDAVDNRIKTRLNATYVPAFSDVVEETKVQLQEYFQGARREFNIPLLLAGSDFQKQVWQVLLQVPFGKTETYLGLSRKLGNQKAIRAVAAANGANAISIIIPCHRIIGTDGNLVGYAGGLPAKKKLLGLENPLLERRLSMF
ncbi:methylated-DNA--[protein]-cysteine S-methyltransferase [Fulvivirgaceae bacterium BMA12]|uniref:Methylated-DNA--protein-cysteine methyltransferase n=1 Tax=Agaribacillus aureus TaxID=3051825 RepID=A0ABT8LKE2_9BACT|nr:methylated-DNA--[protein]-cysteine S-methyltransferase [Fulvivirgaceae bacterium BMA12]